jgi:formylglycine-generating enzyme required for sulfatase activity
MGLDEEGTHARVQRQKRDLIEPTIAEHHGRLVKHTGDGFLVMFDSPVEAVRCAIVIQQSMVGRNTSLPRDQWILYRLGVHLGDVIIEPEDIYGDGVNIAARLEGIANPGDVFISGGVYEQIKNKLVCGYQPLGDRQVKNITDPVTVYRVLPDPAAVVRARRTYLPLGMFAALGLGAIIGTAGWYWFAQERPALVRAPAPPAETPKSAPPPPQQQAAAPARPQAIPDPAPRPAEIPRAAPAAPPAPVTAPVAPAAPSVAPAAPVTAPVVPATPVVPVMISLAGGTFAMGSNDDPSEKPIHRVTIKPFAISKFPVTMREWKACVAAKACTYSPAADASDDAPVTNVSWNDAQQFVAWLSQVTQKTFRLPSEAEWEYAARGGTATKFWWGDQLQAGMANCKGCGEPYNTTQPQKVGSFTPNPFGLHDMGGAVNQWVSDCWHKNYAGAPVDGSSWLDGDCSSRVIRSGSWRNNPDYVRAASRDHYDTNVRYPTHGFRVALSP